MKGVIMAGGKGTRLFSLTQDLIPKPMVNFCGKPLISYSVECLVKSGVTDIYIIVGHLGEKIRDYIGDGTAFGAKVEYISEDVPLGTAGALYYLKDKIDDDFILVYADVVFDIDFVRMHEFHILKNSEATLFVHPNSHPFDSDIVLFDSDKRITGIDSKNNVRDYDYDNYVNAGAFIFSGDFLKRITAPEKTDLEKQLLCKMMERGENIFAYTSPEYIKDVGTPDRLHAAEDEYSRGIVAGRNLRQKQKCVFLDRDGTINIYGGLVRSPDKIFLYDGAADAIKKLNSSGYLTIVITNQPVIARGEVSFDTLDKIHKRLKTLLGEKGAYLDDIYFCPHHPDSGYDGEIKELKFDCDCRKPKTGMVDKAAAEYNIDLENSWFVGDTYRDVATGKAAGTKTILLTCGEENGGRDFGAKPDFVCADISDAVNIITDGRTK